MQTQNKQKKDFFSSERPHALGTKHGTKTVSIRYVIVFLVCANIVAIFGYVFLFGFILNKKDAIVEAISKLDVEQLREEQLYILRDSFRQTEKEQEALLRYFINEEELVAFIEDIEQAGRHTGVFLRFNVVNIRETENILAMEFETVGSFNEIFYFLQLLEHIPIKISLEKFLLDKEIPRGVEKRKESDTWHAIFTLAVLSFDPDSNKTSKAATAALKAGRITIVVDPVVKMRVAQSAVAKPRLMRRSDNAHFYYGVDNS